MKRFLLFFITLPRLIAFIFLVVEAFLVVVAWESIGGQDLFGSPLSPLEKGASRLDSTLADLAAASRTGGAAVAADFASRRGLDLDDGRVRVVVEAAAADSTEAAAAATLSGGRIETTYRNLIQAAVPVQSLEPLSSQPSVSLVRPPHRPLKTAVTSGGVADIGASPWHAAGGRGGGMKVAILDPGFAGYDQLIASGELPAGTITRSFRADGDITGGGEPHGAACAEIVHDVAPDARIYLVNFNTDVELGNAVNYVKNQGIDVVSASWVFPQAFPGDGTGDINDMVAGVEDQGIFWANSAGNAAQNHWSGAFSDIDGDGLTEFSGLDEKNDISASAGDTIYVFLTWNKWPTTNQNYDLYLYKQGNLTPVASSTNPQTGTQQPAEELFYNVPAGQGGTYEIAIKKISAAGDAIFQLFGYFDPLQYQVAASSIAGQPADSPDAMTVGAVRVGTTTLEGFSSRGPTLDDRIKPDIVAPDGVSTQTYSPQYFYGTSASAPHAAGAAALVKSANPGYSSTNMRSALETGATDLGAAGKDNLYGSGKLNMGTPPPPSYYFSLYDYGNANTGLWRFGPTVSGFAPNGVWGSGPGNWDWSRSKIVAADVDNDSKTELAVLYNYGNATTGLFLLDPDSGYNPGLPVWLSGPGGWDWSRSKIVAADVDNDGKTELAVLYDYGGANTGLFIFDPGSAPAYAPNQVWLSGPGGWDSSRSKVVAANVDSDGKTELAALYDYGNMNTGLLFLDPDAGYSPGLVWVSGAGGWDWSRSKVTSADQNGDGKTEVAVFYNYGNANTGLWLFKATGSAYTPGLVWASGAGGWDWSRSKIVPADQNGDGRLAVFYDYSSANTGLWIFDPSGSGYAPRSVWVSGAGGWDWSRSKFV